MAPDDAPTPRPLGRAVLVGLGVFVAVTAIGFVVIAIPLYTLASFESNGLSRPFIRTGLFRVALPVGLVMGAVSGVASGRWFRRGGRWSVEPGVDRYVNR